MLMAALLLSSLHVQTAEASPAYLFETTDPSDPTSPWQPRNRRQTSDNRLEQGPTPVTSTNTEFLALFNSLKKEQEIVLSLETVKRNVLRLYLTASF